MRHTPEAGAVCGNSARTDLRGGRGVNLRPYRNTCLRLVKRGQVGRYVRCGRVRVRYTDWVNAFGMKRL